MPAAFKGGKGPETTKRIAQLSGAHGVVCGGALRYCERRTRPRMEGNCRLVAAWTHGVLCEAITNALLQLLLCTSSSSEFSACNPISLSLAPLHRSSPLLSPPSSGLQEVLGSRLVSFSFPVSLLKPFWYEPAGVLEAGGCRAARISQNAAVVMPVTC